jgi:hypothetical protein
VPAACVKQVVRIGDVLEWKSLSDDYRQRASAGRGHEICGPCSLASLGKSSLPSSRIVVLLKSMGQKGKVGRSCRLA